MTTIPAPAPVRTDTSTHRVSMPPCDHVPRKYEGPSREELIAMNSMILHDLYFDSLSANGGAPSGEADRIDQLRRTFQLRRFGSGYDRNEVDRLFDGLIGAMSGRNSMQITESELDPQQFSLVPGGYFESEVDQALREIRDIIRRR